MQISLKSVDTFGRNCMQTDGQSAKRLMLKLDLNSIRQLKQMV